MITQHWKCETCASGSSGECVLKSVKVTDTRGDLAACPYGNTPTWERMESPPCPCEDWLNEKDKRIAELEAVIVGKNEQLFERGERIEKLEAELAERKATTEEVFRVARLIDADKSAGPRGRHRAKAILSTLDSSREEVPVAPAWIPDTSQATYDALGEVAKLLAFNDEEADEFIDKMRTVLRCFEEGLSR